MKILLIVVLLLATTQHVVYAEWIGIVIHHSGSNHDTVANIRTQHVDINGWNDVGYNYIITRSGETVKCRSLAVKGAHDRGNKWHVGRNSTHIGICLIGDDTFTDAQLTDLKELLDVLDQFYPALKSIERHHEQCPGPGLDVEELDKRYD